MSGEINNLGFPTEAVHKHRAPLPKQEPGKHLWIVTGLWKVTPTPVAKFILDTENLITIDGPGCFWCEQLYRPGAEAVPCKGHP